MTVRFISFNEIKGFKLVSYFYSCVRSYQWASRAEYIVRVVSDPFVVF
jgi:hypothetical protein